MSRTKIFITTTAQLMQAMSNNNQQFLTRSKEEINSLIKTKPEALYSLLEHGIKSPAVSLETLDILFSCIEDCRTLQTELGPLLMLAVEKAALEKIEWLIQMGAKADYIGDDNTTPLLYATNIDCESEVKLKIVKTLLDNGASPSLYHWDDYDDNPFFSACVANDKQMLELFCQYDVSSLLLPQHNQVALWHVYNMETAKLLVAKGADVNYESNGENVLSRTALSPNPELLQYYLSICNKSLIDNPKALEQAIFVSLVTNVSLLLQHGAKVSADTLSLVAKVGSSAVAELILNYVKLNGLSIPSEGEQTLIDIAVLEGNYEVIKTLTKYGVDVNHQNSQGKTALHLALEQVNEHQDSTEIYLCIKELLACKASIDLVDLSGVSAASYDVKVEAVAKLLKQIQQYDQQGKQNLEPKVFECEDELFVVWGIKELIEARYGCSLEVVQVAPDYSLSLQGGIDLTRMEE